MAVTSPMPHTPLRGYNGKPQIAKIAEAKSLLLSVGPAEKMAGYGMTESKTIRSFRPKRD
jgi:hypothetical protein